MQLEGLVEDVDLAEVLGVLGVSGRSGTLHVGQAGSGGLLVLCQGRVVGARVDADKAPVEGVLLKAGLLDDGTLAGLTAADRKKPFPACLGSLMVVAPELEEDATAVLRARLVDLSARVLATRTGAFRFLAGPDTVPPCFLGDQGVNVANGMDVEELLAAARGAAPRPATSATAESAAESAAPRESADLLVVDNDAPLLEDVGGRISRRGLRVRTAGSAAEGLDLFGRMDHAVAVVDLVMPRVDGRGILGGLDLVRRIRALDPARRVVLTSEVEHPDAEARARELGVSSVVRKPPPGRATDADHVAFLDAVLAAAGFNDRAGSINLGQELLSELGEALPLDDPSAGAQSGLARALELLRDMVGPVNDPERRDEIPLMILRVASGTFSRAALFLVAEGQFVGLGGFGLDSTGRDPGKALRDTHIPADADTVLAHALRARTPSRTAFFQSEWNRYLADRLGGPVPQECYVAPVVCHRSVEAVLYADNAVDGAPLGDSQVLEVFLTQAGAAMERATLERRLLREAGAGGGA